LRRNQKQHQAITSCKTVWPVPYLLPQSCTVCLHIMFSPPLILFLLLSRHYIDAESKCHPNKYVCSPNFK
jgi:hypothetical protein